MALLPASSSSSCRCRFTATNKWTSTTRDALFVVSACRTQQTVVGFASPVLLVSLKQSVRYNGSLLLLEDDIDVDCVRTKCWSCVAEWAESRVFTATFINKLAQSPHSAAEIRDSVMRWLQRRFNFDSTAVRLLVKGH